jgi:HAD superfamily hydrolase (TIGR01490 family)
MSHTPLAVFDLDGTLVDSDTLLPFLVGFARRAHRLWPIVRLPVDLSLYAFRLLRDRAAKERLLHSFCAGQSLEQIACHAHTFRERWLPRHWRPTLVEQLRRHQDQGHRVVLVSASPDLYVPTVADALAVSEVVCTRVASANGVCLGRIVGDNCKGESKVKMLEQYLDGQGLPPGSFAYGDSRSDLPLLRRAEHGFLYRAGELVRVAGEPGRS